MNSNVVPEMNTFNNYVDVSSTYYYIHTKKKRIEILNFPQR